MIDKQKILIVDDDNDIAESVFISQKNFSSVVFQMTE